LRSFERHDQREINSSSLTPSFTIETPILIQVLGAFLEIAFVNMLVSSGEPEPLERDFLQSGRHVRLDLLQVRLGISAMDPSNLNLCSRVLALRAFLAGALSTRFGNATLTVRNRLDKPRSYRRFQPRGRMQRIGNCSPNRAYRDTD
jgi:hypothetical protein